MATTLPLRLTLALALTLTPLTATAQFRSGAASWIPVPTGEITFSDRADDELVTNQYFSSDGKAPSSPSPGLVLPISDWQGSRAFYPGRPSCSLTSRFR